MNDNPKIFLVSLIGAVILILLINFLFPIIYSSIVTVAVEGGMEQADRDTLLTASKGILTVSVLIVSIGMFIGMAYFFLKKK